MRAFIIFVFCLSISFNSFSAIIKWLDVLHKKAYRIDTQSKMLEIETSPEKWQSVGKITLVGVQDFDIPTTIRFVCLQGNQKNLRYLLADCTHQVYEFDFETLTLKRIDKTFFRGYNCHSTKFVRNNIIYSFGGYGLFRTNNLMTYFQQDTKQWIALNPINDAPKAMYLGLEGYYKEQDVYFSGLNYFQNDSENGGKWTYDFGFYNYDFKSQLWQKLGIIEGEVFDYIKNKNIEKNIYWNGKYFVIHYYSAPYYRFLIIDPIKNEVYQWDDKEKVLGTTNVDSDMAATNEYLIGDSLYHVPVSITQITTFTKSVFSIEQMKQNAKLLGKLYVSESKNCLIYLFTVLGLIGSLGFILLRRKKSKVVDNQMIVELNDIEKRVLKDLMTNKREEGLSTEQLNELLKIGSKSVENQRKLRSDFLKNFEAKLSQIYQISSPIERIPSKTDKRMMVYKVNEEVLKMT